MLSNSMTVVLNADIYQLRARHSNAPQTEIHIPGNVFVPTIPDNVIIVRLVSPVLNREPLTYTHVAMAIPETRRSLRHTAGVPPERLNLYIDNQSNSVSPVLNREPIMSTHAATAIPETR